MHPGAAAHPARMQTVLHWRTHAPAFVALPHPNWRNNVWLGRNPWFAHELLPWLRARVRSILDQSD
jgi:uracil-DNA glycosylase